MPPVGIVVRRFALWSVICTVSAAPSFFWARSANADPAGMVAAVALFVVLYTAATCTGWFEHLRRQPFVRETLYVGYGLRLLASLGMFLSLAVQGRGGMIFGFLTTPDLLGGMLSLQFVSLFLSEMSDGNGATTFHGAFLTTYVQGAILNFVLGLVMLIVYALQRMFRRPVDGEPRGFEVVPPGPLTAPATDASRSASRSSYASDRWT